MLNVTVTRVTPGRPEASLAQMTITPRSPRRQPAPEHGRYDCHLVTGPKDERLEEHIYIDRWDSSLPAVELVRHALNVAAAQREHSLRGIESVVMPASFAAFVTQGARHAFDTGHLHLTEEELAYLVQLERDVADVERGRPVPA